VKPCKPVSLAWSWWAAAADGAHLREHRITPQNHAHMRVVREYFGVDRTTVTYEHQITGVAGDRDEFFVLCEAGRQGGRPAVRSSAKWESQIDGDT
jgi:hypothetical protein